MWARPTRVLHRLHRALGTALWLLLASWFASGAVMTFGGYPALHEDERLALAAPLDGGPVELPESLRGLAARDAGELRLAQIEGEPRWLFTEHGRRRGLRARAPYALPALDAERARAEGERLFGAPVVTLRKLSEPDQWTVALPAALFPLWRVQLSDAGHSELYLCAASGELVQHSVRRERILAWLGAIPHWIYPTLLRRERALWRSTVLSLSTLGLLLTLSGLWSGLDVRRRLLARRGRRARRVRDPILRWHQRLGLTFGLLASSWLFSGALSFTPFGWTATGKRRADAERVLHGPAAGSLRVAESLAACGAQLSVRELTVRRFLGRYYLLCAGPEGTLLVRQGVTLAPEPAAPIALLAEAGALLASPHGLRTSGLRDRADDYHYASHLAPRLVLPFFYVETRDQERTSFYLDPRRLRLLALHTERTRLERWLYQGLHSWDLPWLVRRPFLWRGLLLTAMASGFVLSALAGAMVLRKLWRRRLKATRA